MTYYPCFEVTEFVDELGGAPLHKCVQCGTCTGLCPWSGLTGYSMRKLNVMGEIGAEGIEDIIWECSTCGLCVARCIRDVDNIEVVKAIRLAFGEGGALPAPLRGFVGSLREYGNPWSGERDQRTAWAKGAMPAYDGQEYGWFPCCTNAYDPRNKAVARAQLALLQAMGIDYGAFGDEMVCCAESLGKVGEPELLEELRDNNRQRLEGVGKLLVSSPHCLDTFEKEYELEGLEPTHLVELIAQKLADGTLKPQNDLGVKVAYHDPCYLGRHNEVYEAPRDALSALPGVQLLELSRNREVSFCCGGGGGKMWVEVPKGQRPSEVRVQQALGAGADVLATACPYCISMFDDAAKTLGVDERIRIVDVAELVAEACGLS